jgi:hypothetical protein
LKSSIGMMTGAAPRAVSGMPASADAVVDTCQFGWPTTPAK